MLDCCMTYWDENGYRNKKENKSSEDEKKAKLKQDQKNK